MTTVTTALAGVPAELWDRLHVARRALLLLDYDGTLAPFQDAFRAQSENGIGIRVGDDGRTTLARGILPSATAVPECLSR